MRFNLISCRRARTIGVADACGPLDIVGAVAAVGLGVLTTAGADGVGGGVPDWPEQMRLTIPLDADGTWTVGDFVSHLGGRLPGGRMPISQSLPVGTVFAGPQVVVIELATAAAEEDPAGAATPPLLLELVLRDVTPPEIVLDVETSAELHRREGMVPFVIAPAFATITVDAVDAVDATPQVEVRHNGVPVVWPGAASVAAPLVLDEIGVHRVTVRAIDASGNVSTRTKTLQVRPRDFRPAFAVVESMELIGPDDGQPTAVDLTVRLGADEFHPWGVHLGSTQVILVDDGGEVMAQPSSIRGVDLCWEPGEIEPAIFYGPDTIDAVFADGHWRLGFTVTLHADRALGAPASMMVVGRSAVTRADDFDFLATASTTPSDDPVAALAAMGADLSWPNPGVLPHPGTPPGDPPIQCEWRVEFAPWVQDACSFTDPTASNCGFLFTHRQAASVELTDAVGSPTGRGDAVDNGCPGSAAAACGVAAGGTITLWLQPTPPCTECIIRVDAFPRFTVRVSIDRPAMAMAAAHLTVAVGRESATASGGVAVGSRAPTHITVGPSWSIPIELGPSKPDGDRFGAEAPLAVVQNGCSGIARIGSSGRIKVFADGWNMPPIPGLLYAEARATITDPELKFRMIGIVLEGPCMGKVGGTVLP